MMKNELFIDNGERPIGGTLYYGSGFDNTIVALHGYSSSRKSEHIRELAEIATQNKTAVLSFDLPEHGDRRSQRATLNMRNCVEDLKTVIAYAREELTDKISLYGSSFGAYVCLVGSVGDFAIEKYMLRVPALNPIKVLSKVMKDVSDAETEKLRKLILEITAGGRAFDVYDLVRKYKYSPIDIIYSINDEYVDGADVRRFEAIDTSRIRLTSTGGGHDFTTTTAHKAYTEWLNNAFK